MRIFRGATHHGELPEATHRGGAGSPGCGPHLALAFRVEGGVVLRTRFATYGCPTAIACGEIVCTICEGRPLADLPAVTPADVTLLVGGVPEGKEHCPELAARALADLRARARGPPPASREPPRRTEAQRRSVLRGAPRAPGRTTATRPPLLD